METHTEQSQRESAPKQKIHAIDKIIRDLFWPLSEGSDEERVGAAERLCQRILETKSKDADTALSEQKYCVRRLVRGMASTRKFARVGFAVALSKLLRQVKDIQVEEVLASIKEELKVSAHDPKSEVGNKLLGCVLAYGTLLQSARKLKMDQLNTVFTELMSLGKKKSYLRSACTETLVSLIQEVSSEQLTELWPQLAADLQKGWEECTPDRFLLLLACRHKDKKLVDKEFLQTHWGASKIVGKKTYEHVMHLLRRSVETPQLQSALVEAVSQEIQKSDDKDNFWTKVGNPLLASTVPRKQVAMALFCQLLERSADLTLSHKMLFPTVAAVICKTAQKKDEQLADICTKAESLLANLCKKETEGSCVLDIVKGFLQTCHRLKSYEFLRSGTFSTIVSSLQGQAVHIFAQMCMDCIMGKGDLLPQEEETEKKFSLHLVPLLRVAALNPTVQQGGLTGQVLQFILLHTFFKPAKDIPQCEEVSPELRSVCHATFYKSLMQLLSTKPERVGQEEQVLNYIRVLTDLALYTQKLLSSPDEMQPVKDISEEVREEWKTVVEIITSKTSQKRKSTTGTMGEMDAFTLLILHLAFDLFTEPESTSELLHDIYVCCEKAAKKQKSKRVEDGEPQWVEVITEILLSMMSRASKLARKTTVAVFRSLSGHLTPAAVGIVTEVLKSDKSKKDEDLFEFEDTQDANSETDKGSDDDEDDEEEEDMEVDDDSDEDDDDDDEDDDEGDQVDEQFRRQVKAALGSAAVASDEEDEEEEADLSDSEMFKRDEQLAALFRSMKRPTKKEKKEKRREVGSFRLRALDLLEVIVKGDRCGDFLVELMEPLLRLVRLKFKGLQDEGQPSGTQQLCNRATELFHIMCKQRNVTDSLHSREELLETVHSLLQMAQSGLNPQLATEIANGCLCIMRLMSHQPEGEPSSTKMKKTKPVNDKADAASSSGDGQEAFVQTIQAALEEDLVTRKNSRYSVLFFTAMVQKYPNVFWPLVSTVLKSLQSADTKVHTKTQACSLLVQLLRLNKRDSLSEEQWSSFYSSVPPVLKKLVVSQQKESLKAGLLLEVLTALFHLTHMTTIDERKEVLSADLLSHLTLLKGSYNKDTRKMHNKLTQLLVQSGQKNKKGKKRKHEEQEAEQTQNGTAAKAQKTEQISKKGKKKKHKGPKVGQTQNGS